MVTTDPPRSSLLRRDPDFRRYWAGHTISAFGTQLSAVALPLVAVLTLDAGAGKVAAVATAAYLPNVLVPLVAGHLLEHRRRRGVMVTADVLRALLVAVVPVAYTMDLLSIPLLAAVAFLIGAASVVFDTASFAYLPAMVAERDLAAANRAVQGSATVAQVAGPGLAGGLVALAGPPGALLADAVSYLASAVGIAAARRPEPAPPRPEGPAGFFAGLRPIVTDPFLRSLTVHAAVYNAAAQILTVNLTLYVVGERGLTPGAYGLILSAGGAGSFLGTLIALRLAAALGFGRAFAAALVLSTLVPLGYAVLPGHGAGFAVALAAAQAVAGVGLGIANVLSVTLRQVVAPRDALARTGAGYRLFIYGVIPVGSALGGVLGEAWGSRAGVAAGAAGVATSIVPMLTRRIRGLRTLPSRTP
ncbi:MFS transporter [Actinoplanes sp. NPDC051494]|uniref:MFS transporter n=1 Tax=Actinoplanes sp. NPDC051494 TaxID=3363907 RepID=UPI0037915C27